MTVWVRPVLSNSKRESSSSVAYPRIDWNISTYVYKIESFLGRSNTMALAAKDRQKKVLNQKTILSSKLSHCWTMDLISFAKQTLNFHFHTIQSLKEKLFLSVQTRYSTAGGFFYSCFLFCQVFTSHLLAWIPLREQKTYVLCSFILKYSRTCMKRSPTGNTGWPLSTCSTDLGVL